MSEVDVSGLDGSFLRSEAQIGCVRNDLSRDRGSECRTLKIGDFVRRDAEDERLERASFVAVAGQRVQHGEQYLLCRIICGEVSCRDAAEPPPAIANHQRAEVSEQRLGSVVVPIDGSPDESPQVTVLRTVQDRSWGPARYIVDTVAGYITAGDIAGHGNGTTEVVELTPYRRSADEAPAEAHGDRLGTVGGADLAEQPPGVRLHSVL